MINHSRALNSNHAPTNMEITGPYGTGKTTAVKKYFEIIENKFNVATAYINCEFEKTENQILTKIYNKLYKKSVKAGITTNMLKNKIVNYLGKTEKILIVCLDDYGYRTSSLASGRKAANETALPTPGSVTGRSVRSHHR